MLLNLENDLTWRLFVGLYEKWWLLKSFLILFLVCCRIFLAMRDLVFVELVILCLSSPHQTIKSYFRNSSSVFLTLSCWKFVLDRAATLPFGGRNKTEQTLFLFSMKKMVMGAHSRADIWNFWPNKMHSLKCLKCESLYFKSYDVIYLIGQLLCII